MILNSYDEDVQNVNINYSENGTAKQLLITEQMFNDKYLVIQDVDAAQPVTITRDANIQGCIDVVSFEPYELSREEMFINSQLNHHLKEIYGVDIVDRDLVSGIEELYINTDLETLEDLFYFTSLKKVVVGNKRYLDNMFTFDDQYQLVESQNSMFALNQLHELEECELELYNNHFGVLSMLSFAKKMGNPVLPSVTLLDVTDWTITSSTEIEHHDSNVKALLDNDGSTHWLPTQGTEERNHEIVIDMQSTQSVKGFWVRQPKDMMLMMQNAFPRMISIDHSVDNITWSSITIDHDLGRARGETNVIEVDGDPIEARYIKFTVKDNYSFAYVSSLADFMIY